MERRSAISCLAGLAFSGLVLFAAPASATPPDSCQCTGGIDRNNQSISPSDTYCGYQTCGLNNVQWECTNSTTNGGWEQIGSCGSAAYTCQQGLDQWGYEIPVAGTYWGYQTCGAYSPPTAMNGSSMERWSCGPAGWSLATPACTFCEACTCYKGLDQNGNPIPPSNTSCGFATLGAGGEKWQCTAGGWEKYSTGGATDNAKFGINTASFIETSKEPADMQKAETYRMGWYQMMIGNQLGEENQINWLIADPLQTAYQHGLKSIVRLCTGSGTCNYQDHPERLVKILNDAYLQQFVEGKWFVITGPNEPPAERWMTTAVKNLQPACANGTLCDSQLDTIASAMADFVDHVMDNVIPAHLKRNGGDIGLLSPVWDCHNTLYTKKVMTKFQSQLKARGRSMVDFDGIAINAYNLHGKQATAYIKQCETWLKEATETSNYKYYVTETGMLEASPYGDNTPPALARDNLRELLKALRTDADIKAVLLFNATGRNPDTNFTYNVLTKGCEWKYITGGHAQL